MLYGLNMNYLPRVPKQNPGPQLMVWLWKPVGTWGSQSLRWCPGSVSCPHGMKALVTHRSIHDILPSTRGQETTAWTLKAIARTNSCSLKLSLTGILSQGLKCNENKQRPKTNTFFFFFGCKFKLTQQSELVQGFPVSTQSMNWTLVFLHLCDKKMNLKMNT